MRSFLSIVANIYFRLNGYKKMITGDESFKKYLARREEENRKPVTIPSGARFDMPCKKEIINGVETFFINKKDSKQTNVFYLHGGGYIEQPVLPHWQFIKKLVKATDCTVTVPIYKKAPEHKCRETIEWLSNFYLKTLNEYNSGKLIFMGDSAGGGLLLAFAEYLAEHNHPLPSRLIMISPWLDATMLHPDIDAMESKDPTLSFRGLLNMGLAWAGDLRTDNYLVSPIFGNIDKLPEMTLFVGEDELFLPDSIKFKNLAAERNKKLNYYQYPKMNHAYVLYPIREARKSQSIIFKEVLSV
ncbi:MAG: alpha/beta hydrolase [Spirochaetales bacterium]|nr:alpha/beta hydrolase [Spirochaetales bacterium]